MDQDVYEAGKMEGEREGKEALRLGAWTPLHKVHPSTPYSDGYVDGWNLSGNK